MAKARKKPEEKKSSSVEIKKPTVKKISKERLKRMSFWERCAYRRALRADKRSRQRAEMLSTLPKKQPARFFAHFSPKRAFHYVFSSYGFHQIVKFCFACLLIGIIALGGLFLYYKRSLEDIQLGNLVISDTVNTYLDRNGVVLWEDTGNEDYRLVVEGSEISTYMRQATVAIEDKNFYNHPGVDIKGLIRAVYSTLTHQGVQGGSTLTQQLIKQVYFAEEAASANRGGIKRKIKELILSLELERMYDKEQIITMYLNESPYGGRRNGVESAAQTYFGKSAKELDIAESALLAAIPNNPAILNPYYTPGNEKLIARQQKTLAVMRDEGYITSDQYEEAIAVDILDRVRSESSQYANMLAPHFVLEVKSQLEEKYGISMMRAGGFTIKTTLDYEAQKIAEDAVKVGEGYTYLNGSDDIALVSLDVETSQVIAMVGSIDFDNKEYGEVNVATSLIEPGSSIKPILDYAPLFVQREGQNYGPGSIIPDTNFDSVYCAGFAGYCHLGNSAGTYSGNVPIRYSLGHSLNIPAVKALYINGIEDSLKIAHALGDVSYCANGENAGLSMAIGSGCTVRLVEHTNAYVSLARGGSYKDISYILEIKNSDGDVLESWNDAKATRVVDEQVAYMLSSILSDPTARYEYYRYTMPTGFVIPDVWTATKTGTTTTADASVAKDSLMMSYSTAIATGVWNGNHDGSGLTSAAHDIGAYVMAHYMEHVHKDVYQPQGKWSYGDEPVKPSGIQQLKVAGIYDYWPSWFDIKKNSGSTSVTMEFNKYTKKLAAPCTIDSYKISIEGTKTVDPITKAETYSFPDGYDKNTVDDCNYIHSDPKVTVRVVGKLLAITVVKGSASLSNYTIYADGVEVESGAINSTTLLSTYTIKGTESEITVTITDEDGASASSSVELTPRDSSSDKN